MGKIPTKSVKVQVSFYFRGGEGVNVNNKAVDVDIFMKIYNQYSNKLQK